MKRLYSTQTTPDDYKVKTIRESIDKSQEDVYHTTTLRGVNGRTINLDENALKILIAYYEGKHIVVEERMKIAL